jgi:hypothetical protein
LGDRNFGKSDGFVTKLDSTGNILWTKQLGTNEDDQINWITTDGNGNVYVTGFTRGTLGEKAFGKEDVIVVKLDRAGIVDWQKQFGTDSSDVGNGVYVDHRGNVFVSGNTKGLFGDSLSGKTDCFFLKLDNKGNKEYVCQFGTSQDETCSGITGDASSNIYLCGATFGDLGARNKGKMDAFVAEFSGQAKPVRIVQFGTDDYDMASEAVVDKEGNVYIGGSTGGNLGGPQQGEGDCFLAKMSGNGKMLWTNQFGTAHWDGILGIGMDRGISGNIIVSGCQRWPECQSFIRMFKKDGSLLFVSNRVATGKYGGTCGKGVCIDANGNIYHTGMTGGNLFGPSQGEHDIFVVKLGMEEVQIK